MPRKPKPPPTFEETVLKKLDAIEKQLRDIQVTQNLFMMFGNRVETAIEELAAARDEITPVELPDLDLNKWMAEAKKSRKPE